jgi:hypothetical protein
MARRIPTFPEYKAAMTKQLGQDLTSLPDERLWESYIRVYPEAVTSELAPPVLPRTQTRKQSSGPKTVVRIYKGNQSGATSKYQKDAAKMAGHGYFPTSQVWAPGTYGCGSFLFAAILCFVIIGIIVFIYMLIVKPEGTLTVTYQLDH